MSSETDAIAARLRELLDKDRINNGQYVLGIRCVGVPHDDLGALLDEREADKALIAEVSKILENLTSAMDGYYKSSTELKEYDAALVMIRQLRRVADGLGS